MPCCWRCQHSRSRTISGHGTLCRAGEFRNCASAAAARCGRDILHSLVFLLFFNMRNLNKVKYDTQHQESQNYQQHNHEL